MKESQKSSAMSRKEKAFEKLYCFIQKNSEEDRPVKDIELFEEKLHEILCEVECEIMGAELSKFDIDEPYIQVGDVVYHKVLRCEETYFGSSGVIRVERSLYSSREPGVRVVCPMELRAGIIEGRWTPLAARQASWVVAHMTPGEGEQLFTQLGGMKPSKSTLDRLPKQLNEKWEENREQFEASLRVLDRVPDQAVSMGVSLDGVMVPMENGNRKEKREQAIEQGKQSKGPNGYKEASCGTVSCYDEEGNRLCTIRMSRMPEQKKKTLKEILTAEVQTVLAERPDLVVVKQADGAKDNWTFLSKKLDVTGYEVVDFFHVCEHLDDALVAAYGETNRKRYAQFEKLKTILKEESGGVEKVIRSLVYLRDKHPRREKLAKELKYFRRNRHRMDYAGMIEKKLPIGTGVVEAACKTLVTQRLKRSGMRWSLQGGQAILTIRSAVQSNRFDRFWNILAGTYKKGVIQFYNVIPIRGDKTKLAA